MENIVGATVRTTGRGRVVLSIFASPEAGRWLIGLFLCALSLNEEGEVVVQSLFAGEGRARRFQLLPLSSLTNRQSLHG